MPIYEYECEECHKLTEAWQNHSDEPLTTCPECSGPLKKLISMSSFHLKGGGWYADGYSSTNGGGCKSTSCPAKSESASSGGKETSCPKSAAGASACCA